jgi:myo-inositol catabolism protein IolC
MQIGFDGPLQLLAFDHRGHFQRTMFGSSVEPAGPAQAAEIGAAKAVVLDAAIAVAAERPSAGIGILVDETFGGPSGLPQRAKEAGLLLAMPAERSEEAVFDFEYGNAFGDHIAAFEPDFVKVLVRYNVDSPAADNELQASRLRRLSDWLHGNEGRLLLELLVPPVPAQLEAVDGEAGRFLAELRPGLAAAAIAALQDAGVEADVWKLEGVARREQAAELVAVAQQKGRQGVPCILLGSGAPTAQVERWLEVATAVEGFEGFAIGRSIWDAPLARLRAGELSRGEAVAEIAGGYRHYVDAFQSAHAARPVPAPKSS